MKKQWFAVTITVATATTALLGLFGLMGDTGSGISTPALAAPLSLTVTTVNPAVAPNDLDTPIIITGTGFTAELSGTLVITPPTAYLGATALEDVNWVSSTTLTATVPWGMEAGVYTMTVINPDGISATLQSAFTVTNGIGVFTTDGPYGGDLRDIHKKPGTPTAVYALVRNVGLFISENAGDQWKPIYEKEDWATGQDSFVFDAQDSDVIYLGPHLARTMDGGETWEQLLVLDDIPGGRACGLTFPAIHSSLGGVVYAGIGSSVGNTCLPGEGGIFRSDDYGDTWITKTNDMTDTDVQSIIVHPIMTQTILAGTRDGNLYASLNGGNSWSLSGNITGTVSRVYFNPYEPLEAWATSATHYKVYLFRSTDLNTWELVLTEGNGGDDGARWDLDCLPDMIWTASSQVYTSTDNGDSWNLVDGLGGNAIEVTPDNPQEIYAASGRGIRKSNDGGASWLDINNGLAGQLPYLVATSPFEPDLVFVKTRQSIYRSFNGGYAWQDLDYGGGGYPRGDYLAIDPYTSTRIYLGTSIQCDDIFCIEISPDSGETWNLVTTTLPVTFTAGWEGSGAYAIAPHPQIPGRILAGNAVWHPVDPDDSLGMVFASDDYGQSWTFMGPTQPISWIVDIAFDAVDPNLVYMATVGSGHWKSTDGGATWQDLPYIGAGDIDDEIAPHPTLSGHVVIAVGGEGIFASQDAGETWTFLSSSAGSPLVYAPTFPPILYAHGVIDHQGVLVRSMDNGLTWETVEGAPSPTRLATATDGERVVLYIGSAGGLASQADMQQTVMLSNAVLEQSSILGSGVYRMTTRLPTDWVYLPLVVRGYAP